jgi:SAM-dependent methyltransferase
LTPQTWHYGLVAEWWAHFNTDGPELAYFQTFVERGQPALDAGCGTGRLLIPWLRAGYDVDGCDVSPDMIACCRERAAAEGLAPTLFVQPLHELDPPRRYATVVVCGVFGLGTTRAQDEEAIRRLYAALEPGGTLALDNEVPYSSARRWSYWTAEGRKALPREGPAEPDRRSLPDGTEYTLATRIVDVDPLDQCVHVELRAQKLRDGTVVAREEHELSMRMWFRDELVMALRHAGFTHVDVRAGVDDDFLGFVAAKPG